MFILQKCLFLNIHQIEYCSNTYSAETDKSHKNLQNYKEVKKI